FFILAGDVNHDRAVDVGDLGLLATNYGVTSGATWSQGDFNYDGSVDIADLGKLATNYGVTLAPPGAAAVVAGATPVATPTAAIATGSTTPASPLPKRHRSVWSELSIPAGLDA